LYRQDEPLLTVAAIAIALNSTHQNISGVLKQNLPPEEYIARKALRYSVSKTGELNPMLGKTGAEHPRYIGECADGYGYLTILHNNKRQFVHRVVIAEALGISEIPENLSVHHIDGNPLNNQLDNLALCTNAGHKTIHSLQVINALEKSRRSTLAQLHKFGT
jgi:hypothetical protein